MWKLYLLPLAGVGTRANPRRAAYLAAGGVTETAIFDYGASPWCLAAADTTPAQDAAIRANADARALPADLDQPLGAALADTQAYLEAAKIPAEWPTAQTSYRTVARAVAGLLQFAGRYAALNAGDELVLTRAALDLRLDQLTAARRAALDACAASLGYDTSAIVGATLLRQALRTLALQWIGRSFALGGLTF